MAEQGEQLVPTMARFDQQPSTVTEDGLETFSRRDFLPELLVEHGELRGALSDATPDLPVGPSESLVGLPERLESPAALVGSKRS